MGVNVAGGSDASGGCPQGTGGESPHSSGRGRLALAGLAVALLAATALLLLPPRPDEKPGTPAVATAERAQFPGNLADGPLFTPTLFLDARTAFGTAPTPAGDQLRLILRAADGSFAEVRRRPFAAIPVFDAFTTDGTTVAWAESSTSAGDDGRISTEIWAVEVGDVKARRLTADTGEFVGYGSAHDLVIAEGAVHWAAARGEGRTEIRSMPLTGGRVTVAGQDGGWALSAWPWLVDGAGDRTGATTLRNPVTRRDVEVRVSGAELATCVPAWCRVMVVAGGGLVRIDMMRPDGSGRRRIAGPEATAALVDVALLDRFEVLGRPRPDSDLTRTEALVVHDLSEGVTTELAAEAGTAQSRNGVVWWSTGDQDATVWHTVDLRTAA